MRKRRRSSFVWFVRDCGSPIPLLPGRLANGKIFLGKESGPNGEAGPAGSSFRPAIRLGRQLMDSGLAHIFIRIEGLLSACDSFTVPNHQPQKTTNYDRV